MRIAKLMAIALQSYWEKSKPAFCGAVKKCMLLSSQKFTSWNLFVFYTPSPLIITYIPHPHPTPPSYPTPSYNLKTRKQEQRDWTHTKQAVVRTSESRITDTAQLEERKDREWQCRNGEDDFDCDYDFAVRWLIRLGLNLTDMKWKWMPDLMTWYHECVLRNEKI